MSETPKRDKAQERSLTQTGKSRHSLFSVFSKPPSLGGRLALWNALVIFSTLALLGVVVYETITYVLILDLDGHLYTEAAKLEATTLTASTRNRPFDTTFFNLLVQGDSVSEFTTNSLYIKIFDPAGRRLIATSPHLDQTLLPLNHADFAAAIKGQQVLSTLQDKDGLQVHTLTLALRDKSQHLLAIAQICQSLQMVRQVQDILLTTLGFRSLLAAIIAYGFIFWLTNYELRPLKLLSTTMHNLSIQDLQTRLQPKKQVTEIHLLTEAFNRMTERLEESFALQRTFVTDVSHELRTPLTATQGLIDVLLLDPELKDDMRRDLQQVSAEIKRLSRLVANLLTTARAEAGMLPQPYLNGINFVELDLLLIEVARQVLFLNPQCALEIKHLEQLRVPGDADLLKQVLLNLVENALTHAGSNCQVVLALTRSQETLQARRPNSDDRQNEWAILRISDNGTGIDPADLPHIFERYYRSKHSTTRSKLGSGLGLSIARLIVEAHGGFILVESELSEGTCFSVWLPTSMRTNIIS